MKLLTAIIRDEYAGDVTAALNEEGMSVTRISSTGGFWRRGNVTLLIGVEENDIERALSVVDQHAGPEVDAKAASKSHPPSRATIFILGVDSFARY